MMYFSLAANFLLNPVVLFLFFLFAGFAESNFFIKNLPGNMSKINFLGYLVFCIAVAAICYAMLYLLNLAHEKEFSFEYVFGAESLSIGHYFIYIVSAGILYSGLSDGVEGNILAWFMSFLFILSAFVLLGNLPLVSELLNIPGKDLGLNFGTRLFLHCFNPILIFFYLNANMPAKANITLSTAVFGAMAFNLTMGAMLYGVCYLVFKISGSSSFSLDMYLYSAKPIIYFIPYILGAILIVAIWHFTPAEQDKPLKLSIAVPLVSALFIAIGIQGLNFFREMSYFWKN